MKIYQHTQSSPDLVIVLAALALTFAVAAAIVPPLLWAAAMWIGLACLFHSFTVEIIGGELRWRFGSGWLRRSVALKDIVSVRVVRASLWAGGRIRYGFGRTCNLSGFNGVAIALRNGKRFCLGSDEPDALAASLAGNC